MHHKKELLRGLWVGLNFFLRIRSGTHGLRCVVLEDLNQ